MTEGKSVNLLKAAKELNIGIGTAVDFLVKKGFDVDSKPSTKLAPDMYAVLLKEFQGDKIVKDEAKQIVIGKIRRDESTAGTGGANPTDALEDIKESVSETTESAKVEKPAAEPVVAAPLPTAESKTEEPKKDDEVSSPLKVVGKIDLDSLNRGKKKVEEKPQEKKEEVKAEVVVPKVEVTPEPTPAPAPEPVKETVKVETPAPVVEKTVEPAVEAKTQENIVKEEPKQLPVKPPVQEDIKPEPKIEVKRTFCSKQPCSGKEKFSNPRASG